MFNRLLSQTVVLSIPKFYGYHCTGVDTGGGGGGTLKTDSFSEHLRF